MTKSELIAELRGMETAGSQFSNDLEVASLCVAAGRAVQRRVLGSNDLPDKDAAEREKGEGPSNFPRYQVPGQSGPDRYDSDNGNDEA